MVKRSFWLRKINELWQRRNIIWLYGVRRVGKTFLISSIEDINYFDCELPSTRNVIESDVEGFLEKYKDKKIAIDEIHRLKNPSELLKITADYYPKTKIIATGSSTLWATKKFKDTLVGRKIELWLLPINSFDIKDFNTDIETIFLKGGLPQFIKENTLCEKDYYEWVEGYWAKDLEYLYNVSRKDAFLKLVELLILRSSNIFESQSYSTQCEVSRQTIQTYIEILKSTLLINVIRPFHSKKSKEIISLPKIYFFDWGFINAFKGVKEVRNEDKGILWEHIVLNELFSLLQMRNINYWRDKSGHEIDFIIHQGDRKIAIECKINYKDFNPKNFKIFSKIYPDFKFYVIATNIKEKYSKKIENIKINFINLNHIYEVLN